MSKGNHNTPHAASGGDLVLLPRVVRLRDAPGYLGMDRNRFNAEVRPYVTEIRLGKQGVAFDRLELDAWFEDYKSRNGRPGRQPEGETTWDEKRRQGSSNGPVPGTLTNASEEDAFAKALDRASSRKRSHS